MRVDGDDVDACLTMGGPGEGRPGSESHEGLFPSHRLKRDVLVREADFVGVFFFVQLAL